MTGGLLFNVEIGRNRYAIATVLPAAGRLAT